MMMRRKLFRSVIGAISIVLVCEAKAQLSGTIHVDPPRYAVIHLGDYRTPKKIANNGTVLMTQSHLDPNFDAATVGYRWFPSGVSQRLTMAEVDGWVANMRSDGVVIGAVKRNGEYWDGEYCVAIWPSTSGAAILPQVVPSPHAVYPYGDDISWYGAEGLVLTEDDRIYASVLVDSFHANEGKEAIWGGGYWTRPDPAEDTPGSTGFARLGNASGGGDCHPDDWWFENPVGWDLTVIDRNKRGLMIGRKTKYGCDENFVPEYPGTPSGKAWTEHTVGHVNKSEVDFYPEDINEQGLVVGVRIPSESSNNYAAHEAIGPGKQHLGAGWANAINDADGPSQIVGGRWVSPAGFEALLWERDGADDEYVTKPLWTLLSARDRNQWQLLEATSINDHGVIVARTERYSVDADGNRLNGASGVPCAVLLLPIDLIRDDSSRKDDDDLRTKPTDWGVVGGSMRSPRYLFTQNDNIFVKLAGPHGMGNGKFKVNVASESDAVGIAFELAEVEPGRYMNASPMKPLRLSDRTEVKADCVTIKVVDEEVLRFKLLIDGVEYGWIGDVMVDRGEFASCGINVFYGSSTGDRVTVRNRAITNTGMFDGGDGNYPDNVVAQGNPMRTFIKNAGDNNAGNREVDILSISSHGNPAGDLGDHDVNNTHVYTGNSCTIGGDTFTYGDVFAGGKIISPSDITNSSDWNNDVEWVMLLSCLQLNPLGGGKDGWDDALYGNPRRIHGILGAYKKLSGDLRSRLVSFWDELRDNQAYIIDAYTDAMGSGSSPEPWAFIAATPNLTDKLKEMTPDREGVIQFSYLDATSICGRAGSESGSFVQVIDGGHGLLMTDIPAAKQYALQRELRLILPETPLSPKSATFGKMPVRSSDGRQKMRGRTVVQTLNVKSKLTGKDAAALAKEYIRTQFPQFVERIRLKEISSRVGGQWRKDGKAESWTNGYLVQFAVVKDGVAVFESYVNVTINGDVVDGIEFCVYDEPVTARPGASNQPYFQPLDVRLCLSAAMPKLKGELKISGMYEILSLELCYVNQSVAEGGRIDLEREFVPAWHCVINCEAKGPPRIVHVWLDPQSGNPIGTKPY